MKKGTKIGIAVLAIIAVAAVTVISTFNSLVSSKESVNSALSGIETQYQRRADLIPQLVTTVEQAVTSERKTLDDVVKARATATSVNLGENPTSEDIAAYQQAQDELGSSMGRLIAISESYPDLKSTQGFLDLQAQLEGRENRITVARGDYNEASRQYNTRISTFPAVMVASSFGHTKFEYFEATAGAENAPELDFTDK